MGISERKGMFRSTTVANGYVVYRMPAYFIPYAYGTYHTRMVCCSVPYVYGCIVRVYVSASMKLITRTEDYIPKAYFSKAAPKGFVSRYRQRFIISYTLRL